MGDIMNKFFNSYWNIIVKNIIRPSYIKRIRAQYKLASAPSIVSSNCIAGEIYNNLGLRFTSPTINLFFRERDFLKFILNIEKYTAEKLEFIKNSGGGIR